MKRKYDSVQKKHYDNQAKKRKNSSNSTMSDNYVRSSETQFILEQIKKIPNKSLKILDIGCGNGYTLSLISKLSKRYQLTGFEPNDLLRQIAKNRLKKKANIFNVNIRDHDLFDKKYDLIICQRILINIQNYQDQKKALKNILKLSKKNTKFLIIEAFSSGLKNLNLIRKKFKLDTLKSAKCNKYLPDNFFNNKYLKKISHKNENILSSYYLIARVFHPYYLKANNEKFKFNSEFVNYFKDIIPSVKGNYSQLKLLIFKIDK